MTSARDNVRQGRVDADLKPGRLGIRASLDHLTSASAADFARRAEAWGYGALWFPETLGRNAFVAASWLLADSERPTVATGIANIYARDATASFAALSGLSEQSGGRFRLLCVERKVAFASDPAEAPGRARRGAALPRVSQLSGELAAARVRRGRLVRHGIGPADRRAVVAWGDEAAVRARIDAHHAVGADQVCIHAITPGGRGIDEAALERLAPCR